MQESIASLRSGGRPPLPYELRSLGYPRGSA